MARRVFVVLDLRGDGRVLGVFENADAARELVRRYPHYYKLYEHELGVLNPEVLGWVEDDAERALLTRLFSVEGRGQD